MRQPLLALRARRGRGQHPALLLNRFLCPAQGENAAAAERRALLRAACEAARDPSLIALYRSAFDRWRQSLTGPKEEADVQTPPGTRLIVGLGNKGVLEAGLRLHHTYGVPLLPGSALKGIAAHYCHEAHGAPDAWYRRGQGYHKLLFGDTDDGGVIRFEDVWMHPDCLGGHGQGLLPDVITPHHPKWQTDESVAPSDFDSPVPVPFLSVAGRFHVAVCWQGPEHPQASAWTKRALELLQAALADWGAGGKTSSGYGRLLGVSPERVPAAPTAAAALARRRDAGTPAQVTIVGPRPKGGFDVQEEGRSPGTLTLGTAPPGIGAQPGGVVSVLVHNDDPRKPQYKWPDTPVPKQPQPPGPKGRR